MEQEVLVKVEGVSKKFCRELKRSLWYGVQDVFTELLGLKKSQELRKDEFWAVNNVSFELKRGECLGLIGHNGAGKSTLLKILNGLINPDKGKVTMKGKVAALIELGAGFNPILTGRENVFINGAVLGFTQKEIAEKYQDIVAFAELEEFMDTPVQNYSSGMKVRLGFAVAAQMEPDVLIIDEVLAVGDVGFKNKCFNRILNIINGCSVIFVSHSMPAVGRIASKIALMKKGGVKLLTSDLSEAVEGYYEEFSRNTNSQLQITGNTDNIILNQLKINGVDIKERAMMPVSVVYADKINLEIKAILIISLEVLLISVVFMDKEQKIVGYSSHENRLSEVGSIDIKFSLTNQFVDGTYTIHIVFSKIHENGQPEILVRYGNIITFKAIKCGDLTVSPIKFIGTWT